MKITVVINTPGLQGQPFSRKVSPPWATPFPNMTSSPRLDFPANTWISKTRHSCLWCHCRGGGKGTAYFTAFQVTLGIPRTSR